MLVRKITAVLILSILPFVEYCYSQSINLSAFKMQTEPEDCGCFLSKTAKDNSFLLVKNNFDTDQGGKCWIKNNGIIVSIPLYRSNESYENRKKFWQEFRGNGYVIRINYTIRGKSSVSFDYYNADMKVTYGGVSRTYKLLGKCGCSE